MKVTNEMRTEEFKRRHLLRVVHDLTAEQASGVTKLNEDTQADIDRALMVASHAYRSPFKES